MAGMAGETGNAFDSRQYDNKMSELDHIGAGVMREVRGGGWCRMAVGGRSGRAICSMDAVYPGRKAVVCATDVIDAPAEPNNPKLFTGETVTVRAEPCASRGFCKNFARLGGFAKI
eukprot:7459763-Pyramimonas_sp.AAC.1